MPKFYTALGWVVWRVAKRQLRKKAAEKAPSRGKTLKLIVLSVAVSLGATFASRKLLGQSQQPA